MNSGWERERGEGDPMPSPDLLVYLTKREGEIVTLLRKGMTRSDVSEMLGITRSALRMHILRIRRKGEV